MKLNKYHQVIENTPQEAKDKVVKSLNDVDKRYQAFSSELVSKARDYALLSHNSTNHQYDGLPYEVHLQMVYGYACKYIMLVSDADYARDILAAAWAHDVIEDCRQTYSDVKLVIGERAADIVYALTNEKGKTRKDRANEKYYEGIRCTPFATYIKLCDRLANVKYSKETGSRMFEMYRKENLYFTGALWDKSYEKMFDALNNYLKD